MTAPTLTPNQKPFHVPSYTRVLLVDDHELLRKGIRFALQETDNVEVVGEADRWGRSVPAL